MTHRSVLQSVVQLVPGVSSQSMVLGLATMWLYGIIGVLCFIVFCVLDVQKPRNFPPGPKLLPIIGNLLTIKRLLSKYGNTQAVLTQLSQQYGSVIGLRVGLSGPLVYIKGKEEVREVMKTKPVSGVADFVSSFRTMSAKVSLSPTTLTAALSKVLEHLSGQETPTQYLTVAHNNLHTTDTMVFERVWQILTGNSTNHKVQQLQQLDDNYDSLDSVLYHTPALLHLVPHKSGFNRFAAVQTELWTLLSELVYERRRNISQSTGGVNLVDELIRTGADDINIVATCREVLCCIRQIVIRVNTFINLIRGDERRVILGEEIRLMGDKQKRLDKYREVICEARRLTTSTIQYTTVQSVQCKQYIIPHNTNVLLDVGSVYGTVDSDGSLCSAVTDRKLVMTDMIAESISMRILLDNFERKQL